MTCCNDPLFGGVFGALLVGVVVGSADLDGVVGAWRFDVPRPTRLSPEGRDEAVRFFQATFQP